MKAKENKEYELEDLKKMERIMLGEKNLDLPNWKELWVCCYPEARATVSR